VSARELELSEQERRVIAKAAAVCHALLASTSQPGPSVTVAMGDLTDAQRAALRESRDETLRAIRAGTAGMQERLDSLTARSRDYMIEFKQILHGPDRRRPREIADWFEASNEEVGVLKVALAELRDFTGRLEAL
jgi:hypothetical protein